MHVHIYFICCQKVLRNDTIINVGVGTERCEVLASVLQVLLLSVLVCYEQLDHIPSSSRGGEYGHIPPPSKPSSYLPALVTCLLSREYKKCTKFKVI